MQVSNSTGRNTDYRVGSGGGVSAAKLEIELHDGSTYSSGPASGVLTPGGSELVLDGGGVVEFLVGGFLVARASFPEDPGEVILVENADGTYSIVASFVAA